MANIKPVYATEATLTWTPASLANGSYDASEDVSNTTNRYRDVIVRGKIRTGTSPTSGGTFTIFAYGSLDGTAFTGGLSGNDGGTPAAGNEGILLRRVLEVVSVNSTSDVDYNWGPVSLASVFGGVLPPYWGIGIVNNTGVALNATGGNHETKYVGVYDEAA